MMKLKKQGRAGIVVLFLLCFTAGLWAATFNFAEALQKSLYFYDAEKCGPGVTGGKLEWRGDCHTDDQYYGGFHDAGDHVKFGLPQSYAASTVAWAVYEFKDAFVSIGEYDHVMDILKWFCDYFVRCWNGSTFVYQVGEGSVDHNYWGPPELQKTSVYKRPSYSTATNAGSDQCAGAAAALTIMSLAGGGSSYLDTAKALYSKAKSSRGLGYSGGFYNSSYDEDEMSWAAVWLYIATNTQSYLTDIIGTDSGGNYTGYLKKIVASPTDDWQNIWVHSWDTVWGGVFAKLAPITDTEQHWWFYRWNLEYWSGIAHEDTGDTNFLATTPAGFAWLNGWGSARYNAAAQFQAMVYRKDTGRTDFTDWARGQMEYIMGGNPNGLSYIVGYSDKHAMHPHHRAAHGSTTNSMDNPPNHKHTLWGALVGGPDSTDVHKDVTSDYVYNEVACDYNAGLVGALAGLYTYYGSGQQKAANFPPLEEGMVEYSMNAKLEQENNARTQVTLKVDVQPVHPPRYEKGISARYYFDISELTAAGQSISAVTTEVYYDEDKTSYSGGAQLKGPTLYSGSVYYVEIDWSQSSIYGTREFQFGLLSSQDSSYKNNWDPTNDYSRQGITSAMADTRRVPVYLNGKLLYGSDPGGSTSGPTATPTRTTTRTVTGTATRTATRTSPSATGGLKGDVNNDGSITIVDALMVAQYSVGLTPAGFVSARADVNCDGSITIVDALIIAQRYVGLISAFPC